jgi:SAM-dependent methyltransferase
MRWRQPASRFITISPSTARIDGICAPSAASRHTRPVTELRRVRAPVVRIVDHGDDTIVLGPNGVAHKFSGDSAALVRAVLEISASPVTRAELFAELARRAGDVPEPPVDELVALLEADHVLLASSPAPPPAPQLRRVVLAISGAIAAVDTPALVRGLQGLGCEVRIALSRSARRFVAPAALDALVHHAVWTSLWPRDGSAPVPHVNLAEWAELVLVYPASASTIARIAHGDCSDLVAAIVCATRAPVVIAPSMNDAMFASPAVQRNLELLRADQRWLVHPASGIEVAHAPDDRRPQLGAAPPPAAVLDIVRMLLAQQPPAMPCDAPGWERLWASAPLDIMAWRSDELEPSLDAALATRAGRLLDLGTGDGTVAIVAARRGLRVTASDVAPTALARARERAGSLPILFVLDDVTDTRLDARYDTAVDRGLLHCLPPAHRTAYARSVTQLVAPGGRLVVAAHRPGGERGTAGLHDTDVRALLPAFDLVAVTPLAFAGADAALYELERRAMD